MGDIFMARHFVTEIDQIDASKAKVFTVQGRSIGLIKTNGKIYAVRNVSPHKAAPVCQGTLKGTMLPSAPSAFVFGLEDQILQCPWHGWEFDLETGKTMCGNEGKKLNFYPVTIEQSLVYVDL
jgi:nitrite reductase (NADH) small subunit